MGDELHFAHLKKSQDTKKNFSPGMKFVFFYASSKILREKKNIGSIFHDTQSGKRTKGNRLFQIGVK